MKFREEKKVYYGQETIRAIKNFPISDNKADLTFIKSIVLIKKAAAKVNSDLRLLNRNKAKKIIFACEQILKNKFNDQFVVDIYHSGAGTTLHMNINEVIANLSKTHANDDVNFSQSTNDVIPTALRITVLLLMPKLLQVLTDVLNTFDKKSDEFKKFIKPGRTHLRDALPISLGSEFMAYKKALGDDLEKLKIFSQNLKSLGIGGTAVGTGVNSHRNYSNLMIKELTMLIGIKFQKSDNFPEKMQNTSDFLAVSSVLRALAQNLIRIGNDLRLLSSGPGAGFNEIILPEVQKGSSIMPGKVNPSIIEMLTMVCFQVIGFDQAILLASLSGQLELNVFIPLISHNLIMQIKLLTNSLNIFNEKCLSGIKANPKIIEYWLLRSSGNAAILNTKIGYEKSAELMKEAWEYNVSISELAVKKGYLTKKESEKIFADKNLTSPNL